MPVHAGTLIFVTLRNRVFGDRSRAADDRAAGAGVDGEDELPRELLRPVAEWCARVIQAHPEFEERSRLRMRVTELRVSPRDVVELTTTLLQLGSERIEAVLGTGWASLGRGFEGGDGFSSYRWVAQVAELQRILLDGGSLWEVASDLSQLQHRVDRSQRAAMAASLEVASRSSRKAAAADLEKAWAAAYGRDPDPSNAYRLAVRAVEHACVPVVHPKDKTATLGKVRDRLRDSPAKWTVDLGRGGPAEVGLLVGLISVLWTGHDDRHGGQVDFVEVTQQQAESAVQLAVLLVGWFAAGHIRQL
jgi:hypothetical protein